MNTPIERAKEINDQITAELALNNIEDIPENRLYAMKGLYDEWNSSRVNRSEAVAKAVWIIALETEMIKLIKTPWS